jgi:hypothetical protein
MNKYSKIIAGVGLTLMLITGAVGVRAQEQQRQLAEALQDRTVNLGVFTKTKACNEKAGICMTITIIKLLDFEKSEGELSLVSTN